MKPLVSVIMCAYNEERYISEAIESILGQTYSNLELVVVNDGPTDRMWEIISAFRDNRLKQINQGQMGVSAAINVGLSYTSGEIITRFDADDIALPNRFELQARFLEENLDIALVGTFARCPCLYFMENYNAEELSPFINVGTGKEISIKKLAELIRDIEGYEGKILWYISKPNGMPRKVIDITVVNKLGWKAKVSL